MDDLDDLSPSSGQASPLRWPLLIALVGSLLGCVFAAESTSDFMQHLDRQVHEIHCSFIPGAGKEMGETGCKTVMMSPYSSYFRESVWGGVPVSLWALAVYAFLAFRCGVLLWRNSATRAQTAFLWAATGLPLAMTVIFGFLSITRVGTTCKVCIGIYLSSAICFIAAAIAHRRNPASFEETPGQKPWAIGIAEGTAFVLVLTLTYLMFAPSSDPATRLTGCGALVSGEDPAGVMIPLPSSASGGEPAIEVLDPLCPACKAFDTRLGASSLRGRLNLKAVLFPLDPTCNWMVTEALHPGACAVSEALLCAAGLNANPKDEKAALEVLNWAFKNQEALRTLASKDEPALRTKIETAFPAVKGCLGGALVKNKLTKSLRWAVANGIPVLTPQLFVGSSRMCDEDSDLGLEYTLSKMLSPAGKNARAALKPAARPKPAPAARPAMIAEPPPPGESER